MDNDPKEIELKLRVAPEDIEALRNHPDFSGAFGTPTRQILESTYFDSDDRVLREHGLTLRVRQVGDKRIQTIKAEHPASSGFERSEWEQVIDGDQPDLSRVDDTPLAPILTDDVRGSLKPLFETRIDRSAYHLNGNDTDIEIAVDQGKIVGADGSLPVSEIELELKQGRPGELFKIARAINSIVPAQLDVKSKSERGYELIEKTQVAAETASDPKLSAGMTSGRAFTLIGRACLRHLIANHPATIQRDAEGLHQMRIALRRLRAAISLFAPVVADDRVEAIKTELRWLARELAAARDLDSFFSEALTPIRKRHANEPGLVSISKMFARKRQASYRQVQDAVGSDRFRALVIDTAEWIEAGPWSTSDDPIVRARREMPIEFHAAEQLARRSKKIRRRGAKIGRLDPAELHKLRIQVKKTRYATEFFAGVYEGKKAAKRCKRALSSLRRLQNSLGSFNDVITCKALCTEVMDNPGRGLSPERIRRRAFAAGLIIGDQQAQADKLLDRAREAHERFDDTKPFWKISRTRNAPPLIPAAGQP
jgi:inorganic triphosphatase YgiF